MRPGRGLLIFGGMLFLFLAVSGLKAEAHRGGLLAMAGAIGMLLVFVAVQSRVGLFTRRHFQLEATQALQADDRPSILFLRSFHADNQFRVRTGNWLTRLLGKADMPLEAALTAQFSEFGPVIAIGRPGEPLPPLGAFRFYAPKDGEEWKRHVTEFASQSQLIVVMLGETEGLRWEYDLLARANWLGKTVFVTPLVQGESLQKVLSVFGKYTDSWRLQVVGPIDEDVVLFAPGGKGRLIALRSPGLRSKHRFLPPSADHYRKPIALVLDKASEAAGASRRPRPSEEHAAIDTARMTLAKPVTDADHVVLQRRALALFADWFISVLFFCIAAYVVWAAFDPSILEHESRSPQAEEVQQRIAMIGMFLSPLYFLVLEGLCGLSVGKRWFAVRVLTEDDTVPTWSQHIVRTLIKSASMFLCAFPLAAISAIAGKSWHDMAVGTKVVAFRK